MRALPPSAGSAPLDHRCGAPRAALLDFATIAGSHEPAALSPFPCPCPIPPPPGGPACCLCDWWAQNWRTRFFHAALYVSYLCLPASSSEVAKCFLCDKFDDGSEYLAADYRIRCDTARYDSMVRYAAVMLVVFPLGIPVWYLLLLWRKKSIIYHRNYGRQVRRLVFSGLGFTHAPTQGVVGPATAGLAAPEPRAIAAPFFCRKETTVHAA